MRQSGILKREQDFNGKSKHEDSENDIMQAYLGYRWFACRIVRALITRKTPIRDKVGKIQGGFECQSWTVLCSSRMP